jgi:Glycosyl hydrolase family 9/Cellulase N-terminal ig-like domain
VSYALSVSRAATIALVVICLGASTAYAAPPVVLVNHVGYERSAPKRALVQGRRGDEVRSCTLDDLDKGGRAALPSPTSVGSVPGWRDWVFWEVDFSEVQRPGRFRLACNSSAGEIRSFPFLIQEQVLERQTLSDVIYYFKGQRSSGPMDAADHALPLEGQSGRNIDARGGWYDATSDYGKHLSHLSFSNWFNPQQLPLTTWALLRAHELLQRRNQPAFRQYLRRLLDEGAWGADYLVRIRVEGGSFYRSVVAPGPERRPEDRRIARESRGFTSNATPSRDGPAADRTAPLPDSYQGSLRSGGGLAVAALARAAAMRAPGERRLEYVATAEEAWAFLVASNRTLTSDGHENIVDDYCALLAATELFQTTRKDSYKQAADERGARLIERLASNPRAYWRADDGDRPYFHASDAGLPVVSLLAYADVAEPPRRAAALQAVRASLEWELLATAEVPNPFGYARQLVQAGAGARETRFFFPHDTEAAPWWQGENARLASLAYAARQAARVFESDSTFAGRLRRYAQDQIDWILGRNPFDACMLQGKGHNNPEYLFLGSYEYTNAAGGICNGITAGLTDPLGIDFNSSRATIGADDEWRWTAQWLPNATWYLLAVSAGR